MPAPLVLLPGLGADARLFGPQRKLPFELIVPELPEPEEGEPMADYAARIETPRPPFFLGGVSMGGMIAQAMCRAHRPKGLFLIASARRGSQIAPQVRLFERLARAAPDIVIQKAPARWPLELEKFGRLTPKQKSLVLQMWKGCTTTFLRRSARMILTWKGEEGFPCPDYQVHGAEDQLIPAAGQPADEVIAGGGHLINLTHAARVNRFIKTRMLPGEPNRTRAIPKA